MFRQSFPDRLEHELHHAQAHQMRNQAWLGADLVGQLQSESHIGERLLGLAVLQFGHAAQGQDSGAAFQWRQVRQQDRRWDSLS